MFRMRFGESMAQHCILRFLVRFSYQALVRWCSVSFHKRRAKLSELSGCSCCPAASCRGISNAKRLSQASCKLKPAAAIPRPQTFKIARDFDGKSL